MPKLAIFDLDGTLYNTNDVNYGAYSEALASVGGTLDYDYFCNFCNGRNYRVFLPNLVNGDMTKVSAVHKLKKELYEKYIDKVITHEHVFDILLGLKSQYKIAIVTTASKKNTMDILSYTNKSELFDLVLTGDDVKNSKPDPEGFLKAMKYFNSSPEETIIFEDSEVGIEAAKATESNVVVVNAV